MGKGNFRTGSHNQNENRDETPTDFSGTRRSQDISKLTRRWEPRQNEPRLERQDLDKELTDLQLRKQRMESEFSRL